MNDHGVWSSGFRPIVDYLTSKSLCKDLDAGLTPEQWADSVAFSAHISSQVAPLLDLSLYVSAANWSSTTRPAYSKLLSFPLTWTVPTLVRAEAVKRSEHLGLAELDTDFDPNGGLHLSTGRDALPETFRRHLPAPKKTVHDEMTPEQAAAIRLYSVTDDGLALLERVLADADSGAKHPRFLSSDSLTSLDCLAFGHLALMKNVSVPQSFLREWIRQHAPCLSRFVDDVMTTCVIAHGPLPWAELPRSTVIGATGRVLDSVMRSIPSVGDHYADEMRTRAEKNITGIDRRSIVLLVSLMATGVAASYGLHLYRALQPFGSRTQMWFAGGGSRLSQFGDLGSMLNTAMGAYPSGAAQPQSGQAADGRIVEADSEVD